MEKLPRVGRATLDVLAVLLEAPRPRWGLELMSQTGRPSGTVYPLLDRLEKAGWVESRWEDTDRRGPRRRLYALTPDGAEAARELVRAAATRTTRPSGLTGRVAGATG